MYARKSALGTELIEPSTIIAILKLKHCIEKKQKRGNAGKYIRAQEEHQETEAGRHINLEEDSKHRHWAKTSLDEVNNKMWNRKIS